MSLFGGLSKIALSPLKGVSEIIDDVSGKNSEGEQALGIGTIGTSSALKGTAKGLKQGIDEIFD